MRDDISDIAALYDHGVKEEEERLEQHQLEYDLTWRYLTRYLPPAGTVLEIGAATGRYTLALCKRGYSVTAVDLSAGLLEQCKLRLATAQLQEHVQFVVADARDLHAVPTTAFDAVLLMGPLYHLVFEEDRQEAVRQAVERLRSGGLLFSTHLSRLGVFGDFMRECLSGSSVERKCALCSRVGGVQTISPEAAFEGILLASRRSSRCTRREVS